jgi:hypothetical protein
VILGEFQQTYPRIVGLIATDLPSEARTDSDDGQVVARYSRTTYHPMRCSWRPPVLRRYGRQSGHARGEHTAYDAHL